MTIVNRLLPKVKANLVLQHDEDDELLLGIIRAAVAYAEGLQKKPENYYFRRGVKMSAVTVQAVIMLSSHWYEARDGATGGFFADNVNAANNCQIAVDRLLHLGKDWQV